MWSVFTVIAYFVLALLIPIGWALGRVWRRTRVSRQVTCPALSAPTLVTLDPWYAVRMHARGDNELRVADCGRWPERRDCNRECLTQIGTPA
ncbi:hypothetical protein SBA3_20022 [Candidatus Sulfopaludibacter sp. SbA3]|nr:hypothetical protein SBA3_20022 [Candidatus Sulfopaludibacter sp. SbA3]